MEKGKFLLGCAILGEAEEELERARYIVYIKDSQNRELFPEAEYEKHRFHIAPVSPFYANLDVALSLWEKAKGYEAQAGDKVFMNDEKVFRIDNLGARSDGEGKNVFRVSISCKWPSSWASEIWRDIVLRQDTFFAEDESSAVYGDSHSISIAAAKKLPISYGEWYEKYNKNKPPRLERPPVYGRFSDILLWKYVSGSYYCLVDEDYLKELRE